MVVVITGPTCVGKTKLSIELAKKIDGEIVNADSTQIYKNNDIATAKVKEEEKEFVVHHLFDIKNLDEDYTVYDYQHDARIVINNIIRRGKVPILVGGTGLYIKAALYDYKFVNVKKNYNVVDGEELYKKVLELDPNNTINANNRRRLQNALNYMMKTNKPYSKKEKTDKILYDTYFIGLTTDRNILYDRINKRVDDMINNGLLNEAYRMYKMKIRTKAVMTPIGYKELFPYFSGDSSLSECILKIKKSSRHYAKRQYTFFRNQLNVKWFTVDFNNFSKTVYDVLNYLKIK